MKNIKKITSQRLKKTIANDRNMDRIITESIKEHLDTALRFNRLWCEIRFVQGTDSDYNEIMSMFCGDRMGYCEGNSQPVIDYLKQWDNGDCELTTEKPRIARGDTSYRDESAEDYTLLYNSSVGGAFLLYRPATEQEEDWYFSRGEGSRKNKEGIHESIDYDDYATISQILEDCGWAYTDAVDVENKHTGQIGIRYVIEPYPNNLEGITPMTVEQMKQHILQEIGSENVIFSEGTYRYAPEIKNLSMIVLDSNNANESKNMNKKLISLKESALRRIVKETVNRVLMESKGLAPSKRDSEYASNIRWSGKPDLDSANRWRKSEHSSKRGVKKVKGNTKFRDMIRGENERGNFAHKLKTNPSEWFENL